jgi:hypothetical protein
MNFSDYRKIPALNASSLKAILRSPAYYLWTQQRPDYDTDAMRLGRAVHAAVFEPELFKREFAVFPGSARRGKAWDEFKAAHDARNILTQTQHDTATRMAYAVRSHPVCAQWLAHGEAEQTIQWTDPDSGRKCKARLDWIGPEGLIDLKTCRDPDLRSFGRDCMTYRYPLQMGFYTDGARAALSYRGPSRIIAVGSTEPHEVVPYRLDEPFLDLGRDQYRDAIRRLQACEESGQWPGLAPVEMPLVLPGWAFEDFDTEPLTFGGEAISL